VDTPHRQLLERGHALRLLGTAVAEARAGRSSFVLVPGEAGIGKSSLVRAFLATLDDTVTVLPGACDDLLTPRTFGPLRDAAEYGAGTLRAALTADPDRESVYRALAEELAPPGGTAVLVIEDAQWADDATIDALRYLAPRIDGLGAVVVLTFRDGEVGPEHPLRRLLGALATAPVTRIALHPLSRDAVERLGAGPRASELHAVTGGNPFFVTEVLACPDLAVPHTVVDAVTARLRLLGEPARRALEQLAVVPSHCEPWLVDALLAGPDALADAERHGIVEARRDGFAFRHELARRAVLEGLPVARQVALHRAVLDQLAGRPGVDLSRLVHHAVAAGDAGTVLAAGPAAAREAARSGSHRQSLEHYEHVMAYAHTLPDADRARLLVEYGWELYVAQRHADSIEATSRAVRLWERVGDPVQLGQALVVLSRSSYMADRPADALRALDRAVQVLRATGDQPAIAYAETYRAAVLVLTDRQEEALDRLTAVQALAAAAGRPDLVALCHNYLGCARADLGDPAGVTDLRQSLAMCLELGHHEYAARAYTNLGEVLFQLRRYDELEDCLEQGLRFTAEHDLPGHAYNLQAHRALLLALRGSWADAERRLRRLLATVPDPGQMARLTLPPLGRLLARRGDPAAEEVLSRGWRLAMRNNTLLALGPAGVAVLEWAWLVGEVDRADEQVELLYRRTSGPGAVRIRAELLAYLGRAGVPVQPFPGCPPEWAAVIRGDWAAAAASWARIGDPYERALALASSGLVDPTLEALAVLDGLGAQAAATAVRRRLRELGVARIPRGRQPTTRTNPAGLTDRQLDVLALLAEGLTNAEIAQRLVVSPRTVDHHVSAVLMTLGVGSRREAARRAYELGLVPLPST
jgi:DNA-binding CsgD family transcriptional regulator